MYKQLCCYYLFEIEQISCPNLHTLHEVRLHLKAKFFKKSPIIYGIDHRHRKKPDAVETYTSFYMFFFIFKF